MTQRKLIILLITIALSFYFLEGIVLNPFILWTALPLYWSFWLFNEAQKSNSCHALYGAYGFMVASIFASYLYHLAWFFDWDDMKTGSSTSALIFIFFPIYSVILGGVGYACGYFFKYLAQKKISRID